MSRPILNEIIYDSSELLLTQPAKRKLNVLFVSSYVPRKCGIATFCRDLVEGIESVNPFFIPQLMVLTDDYSEELIYPIEAKLIIKQDDWGGYQDAINNINSSLEIDLVCIQHEFGIFGGKDGELVIPFIKAIKKPIITTLHTIMPNPSENQKKIIQTICKESDQVVVMLKHGLDILKKVYQVASSNINVIPHGVPTFSQMDPEIAKRQVGLEGRVVMAGVNLLSEVKGVEIGIRSLPEIVREVPNFIYLVAGETHPVFLRSLGGKDSYREKLVNFARELGVEKNVKFINKYVSVPELVSFVEASDFYLTPYLDPQQATSGALAYAIGAGKVCVSTPYIYAREMLGEGRGVLVPFGDYSEIAKNILHLIKNPEDKNKMEKRTFEIGKLMTWNQVGKAYQLIFDQVTTNTDYAYNYRTI